jgi:hypothetical protein
MLKILGPTVQNSVARDLCTSAVAISYFSYQISKVFVKKKRVVDSYIT